MNSFRTTNLPSRAGEVDRAQRETKGAVARAAPSVGCADNSAINGGA